MSIARHTALVLRVERILKPASLTAALWACAGLLTGGLGGCAQTLASAQTSLSLRSNSLLRAPDGGHFLRPSPQARPAPVASRTPLVRPRQPRARRPLPAGPSQAHRRAPQAAGTPAADLRARQRIEAAVAWLGTAGLDRRPFVADVLRSAGQAVSVPSNQGYARGLYERLERADQLVARGDVAPGDLVFFRDTIDVNGNRRAVSVKASVSATTLVTADRAQ